MLVNNAGLGRNNAGHCGTAAPRSWVEMISTNVLGVCMCTREALKVSPSSYCTASMCWGTYLLYMDCWHLC